MSLALMTCWESTYAAATGRSRRPHRGTHGTSGTRSPWRRSRGRPTNRNPRVGSLREHECRLRPVPDQRGARGAPGGGPRGRRGQDRPVSPPTSTRRRATRRRRTTPSSRPTSTRRTSPRSTAARAPTRSRPCIVIEEVARVCASSSLIPAVNKLGSLPIMLAGVRGAEEAGTCRRSPRGEAMFSYGLSEPRGRLATPRR